MYNAYSSYQPSLCEKWESIPNTLSVAENIKQRSFPSPPKFPGELSEELRKRVLSHQKKIKHASESVAVLKRRFDSFVSQQQPAKCILNNSGGFYNVPVNLKPSIVPSYEINKLIEETYWAKWKPQPQLLSPSNETISQFQSRSTFTAFSPIGKCTSDSPSYNDNTPPLPPKNFIPKDNENLLKIIRKPINLAEKNLSESDKEVTTKLFSNNVNGNILNRTMMAPCPKRSIFLQTSPSIYMNIAQFELGEQTKFNDKNKPVYRNDVIDNSNRNGTEKLKQISHAYNKRSKSCDEKKSLTKYEQKQDRRKCNDEHVKSDEEDCGKHCSKQHVHFCSRKRNCDPCAEENDSESFCTPNLIDSSRTTDGYHGDLDTESYQIRDQSSECDNNSCEEGQGDLAVDHYNMQKTENYFSNDKILHDDILKKLNSENCENYQIYSQFHNTEYYQDYQYTSTKMEPFNDKNRGNFRSRNRKGVPFMMYDEHTQIYGEDPVYQDPRDMYNTTHCTSHPTPKCSHWTPSRCGILKYGSCDCSSRTTAANARCESKIRICPPINSCSSREMDDISEKSYCTSVRDKSPCHEETCECFEAEECCKGDEKASKAESSSSNSSTDEKAGSKCCKESSSSSSADIAPSAKDVAVEVSMPGVESADAAVNTSIGEDETNFDLSKNLSGLDAIKKEETQTSNPSGSTELSNQHKEGSQNMSQPSNMSAGSRTSTGTTGTTRNWNARSIGHTYTLKKIPASKSSASTNRSTKRTR